MALRPGLLGMALGALSLVGLALALLALQHPLSPQGVERLLQRKVEARLAADPRGLGFVQVRMQGQTAVLSGVAPNAALRAVAEQAARTAAGPGGPWRGGVADVENRLVLTPPQQPGAVQGWGAERTARGGLRLFGAAPSAQIHAVLARRAELLLGGAATLEDRTQIGAVPADSAWEAVALDGLHQLARLDQGSLRLVGRRMFLLGVGDGEAVAKARQWARERLPARYSAVVDVAERSEAEAAGFEASAPACTAALAAALTPQRPWFAGAALSSAAEPGLKRLAAVARRCARHLLQIEAPGETPEQRRARAQAVVQFLLEEGVAAEALQGAEGAGASLRVRAAEREEVNAR